MGREAGNTRGPKWPGPPGLSAAEKKRWAGRDRHARKKQDTAWAAKEKDRLARRQETRNRERLPTKQYLEFVHAGMHVQRGPGAAPVSYMDRDGRIHREDRRSAEQVIADHERKNK